MIKKKKKDKRLIIFSFFIYNNIGENAFKKIRRSLKDIWCFFILVEEEYFMMVESIEEG